jgi:putative PEP-CTERM system TPR-repeat lipoprotein
MSMPLFPILMTCRPPRLLLALTFTLGLAACGGESSEVLVDKARQSLDGGDQKAAIIQLKSALQEDGNNAEARFQLGKLYLETGDFIGAEKELIRARDAGYDGNTLNPSLAQAFIGQGEYKRVLDDLPQPVAGSPNEVQMWVARARAQLGVGDKAAARNSLKQAMDITPENVDVLLALAQLALADGDTVKAGEQIDEALRIDSKNRDSWLFKGDFLRTTGNNSDAVKAYETALQLDPGHAGARLALASIALLENRLADARREVDSVLKASRNNLQARYTLAMIDFREEKYAAARDQLATVLKSAPDYLPAVFLAGSVEYALGNMQTAESHLNKAVKVNPRNLYALRLLATAQLRQDRPDDAARTLAGVPGNLNDAGFQMVAGEIAMARKDFAKAAEHFEKAAQIKPDSAAIRTELGLARDAMGDRRAMADLQAAVGMEGGHHRADMVIILSQLKQKKFDAALASIDTLEKKQGASPLSWNYRGAAHLGKQDRAKAHESFSQALKLDPTFFPAAANMAQLHLNDHQPAAARTLFEAILKAEPRHLNAMLALAELSLREKDEKGYVSWLEKASKAHPQALPPRIAMARHLLAKGEKNKALAVAREAVNANPDHPEALNLLGSIQMNMGDRDSAIQTFTTMAKKANQSDAYLRLAMAQFADKRMADTRASLQRALQLKPGHLQSLDALLRLELTEGKPEPALKLARQIQAQHPKSPLGFDREGDVQLSQKRYGQAIKAYEHALAMGSGSAGFLKLFRAMTLAGDTKAAEQKLASWIKQNPGDLVLHGLAADHFMATGRNKEAIAQYQEIVRIAPSTVVALNNLAHLYHKENDSRALAVARQAIKLAPDNPAVQDTTGWILIEQGQLSQGLALLRKAIAKAPESPTLRYHYAVALARSGDKAQARQELEKLMASDQKFPEVDDAKKMLKDL